MNNLGEKIKQLRIQKGWSQEELASSAAINLRTIQRIENHQTNPRGKTLQLICGALEIPIQDLNIDKRYSKSHLVLTHLSAMSFLLAPFLNILLPYLIWQKNRHTIDQLDNTGRSLINFQVLWTILATLTIIAFSWNKIMYNSPSAILSYLFYFLLGINILIPFLYTLFTIANLKKLRYPELIRFLKDS